MIKVMGFLFPGAPSTVLERLQALERAGFLAQGPSADLDQLAEAPDHPWVRALRAEPQPSWGALSALLEGAGPAAAPGQIFVYARLRSPEQLPEPLRTRALEALGAEAPIDDPRAPFDLLELIWPLDLEDPQGLLRGQGLQGYAPLAVAGLPEALQLLRPARTPTEFSLAQVAELRVPESSVAYLAWALAEAGALAPPVYLALV